MTRVRQVARHNKFRGCTCGRGHFKKQLLDERVLQGIGDGPSDWTAEGFRSAYQSSPCNSGPIYEKASHDMGIPIPGHADASSAEDDSDDEENDSDDEESDDEEIGDDAVVPVIANVASEEGNMARARQVARRKKFRGCSCGHLKKQWLDERVLQGIGDGPSD